MISISAYLFQFTGQDLYREAAQNTANFILNFVYTDGVVVDSFDISTCRASDASSTFSYNPGYVMEGFGALANATGNTTLLNL